MEKGPVYFWFFEDVALTNQYTIFDRIIKICFKEGRTQFCSLCRASRKWRDAGLGSGPIKGIPKPAVI